MSLTQDRQARESFRMRMRRRFVRSLFKALFLSAPPVTLDPEKAAAFDAVLSSAVQAGPADPIEYTAPYPKHEFLTYLVRRHAVLLHGSRRPDIQELRPRTQTDASGRQTETVFASGDGIWPMFFAILDRSKVRGSLRNACFVVGSPPQSESRYYFFSINAESLAAAPWAEGSVYLLLSRSFTQSAQGVVHFDEWQSPRTVYPLARLSVAPEDFPFLHQVAGHREAEPMVISWLRYKQRIRSADASKR